MNAVNQRLHSLINYCFSLDDTDRCYQRTVLSALMTTLSAIQSTAVSLCAIYIYVQNAISVSVSLSLSFECVFECLLGFMIFANESVCCRTLSPLNSRKI